ncbi:hypothetical protein [Aquella oligotrophica]|uniref:Band 7 domain-containing protein n=1 Tax=Aquella oligotrophica TaxID=2067065 RepID=A0A2I7N5L2_9NEIS|nr:hypothetical protein [Aquella oligotrophica]AUR51738.1 hypothetical protein CUN60_05320 [Aquella oligotrophica]
MKNVLIIFLLGVLVLFSGLFIVDEREVVVITHSPKDSKVYTTGIHWNLPFYGQFNYVYVNQRNSHVLIELSNESTNQKELVKFNVTWAVQDPVVYVNFLNLNNRKKLEENMANFIESKILTNVVAQISSDVDLIKLLNSKQVNIQNPELGIKIISLDVSEIDVIRQTVKNQSNSDLSAESAYAKAISIMQETNKQKQQTLDKLKAENPEFYSYYSLIRQYQMTAKNKNEVPPFDKLYSR